MVFTLEEIFPSDEEIIPFERYNAPKRAKIWTKDVPLQYRLSHFQV